MSVFAAALAVAALAPATPNGSADPSLDRQPEPLVALYELFSSDDYPNIALRSGAEGTVRVRLTVAATGEVTACDIVETSGTPILDQTACAVLTQRARFKPAERKSEPARFYEGRIQWQLPEKFAVTSGDRIYHLAVATDGTVDCGIERHGVDPREPDDPGGFCDSAKMQLPDADPEWTPGLRLEMEVREAVAFSAKQRDEATAAKAGFKLVREKIVRFTVDKDGGARDCVVEQSSRPGEAGQSCPPFGTTYAPAATDVRADGTATGWHIEQIWRRLYRPASKEELKAIN